MTLAEIDRLNDVPVEMKKRLKALKQSPVAFCNVDLLPSETVWIVPIDVLERQIRSLMATYLEAKEIQDVTIWREPDRKGVPKVIVWLRSDSKHLVEKSERTDDQLISPTVQRYSQQLRDMCDQFAPLKNDDGYDIPRKKRIDILKARHDTGLSGVRLDFMRVADRLFDRNNKGFLKTFGNDSPMRPITLVYNALYDRRDGNKMTAFRITKKYSDRDTSDRRPVPSYRDKGNY